MNNITDSIKNNISRAITSVKTNSNMPETVADAVKNKIIQTNTKKDPTATSWYVLIMLILGFFMVYYYYYLENNREKIRKTWSQRKCSPENLLIAGWFKPNSYKKTSFEYVYENFMECAENIIIKVIPFIFLPYQKIMVSFNKIFNDILNLEFSLKYRSMDIRKELYKYYSKLYSQIQTIFVPLQKLINLFKDSVGKAQGIIIVAVKFLEGVLMAIRGAMIHLWERINKVMVDIVFVWMPTLTTAALGLMALTGGLASIPLSTYIALNLAIIVPVSVMNVIYERFLIASVGFKPMVGITTVNGKSFKRMMQEVIDSFNPAGEFVDKAFDRLKDAGKAVGKFASSTYNKAKKGVKNMFCFDENTLVETTEGPIKIKDLKINSQLKDGSIVTSTFILNAAQQKMYSLNNVVVSGNHKIYYNHTWIPVENHPLSKPIEQYNEPFIYCINTSNKTISINNMIFSDWDDLDKQDLRELNEKYSSIFNEPLHEKNLHHFLESGFTENTNVELEDGSIIPFTQLQINNVLSSGEIILGQVEIKADDIPLYEYFIENRKYIGGPNLQILHHTNTILDTFELVKTQILEKENKLYHVITNTGTITLNGYKFLDYNGAIETLLEQDRNKLMDVL
tara:strand:+ start:4687 stop:6558 length:1872 start_codon:yes stop_codon:yes gene_type:complete